MTTVRLGKGDSFEVPACVALMTQLQELQLLGATGGDHPRAVPAMPAIFPALREQSL
eukprot:gene4024-4272_t